MNSNDQVLVFVKPICKNTDQTYEYDLFFSNTPDIVWGVDWEVNTPGLVSSDEITPDSTTYNKVIRIKTTFPLKTIQETYCYSMEYAIARIIALSGEYMAVYTIDPVTDSYMLFSSKEYFDAIGSPSEGKNFYTTSIKEAEKVIHPEDWNNFRRRFKKKAIMDQIREKGSQPPYAAPSWFFLWPDVKNRLRSRVSNSGFLMAAVFVEHLSAPALSILM